MKTRTVNAFAELVEAQERLAWAMQLAEGWASAKPECRDEEWAGRGATIMMAYQSALQECAELAEECGLNGTGVQS